MTRFESIKKADIKGMARIICAMEHGYLSVPKKYSCDAGECIRDKCIDCYTKWLEDEDVETRKR